MALIKCPECGKENVSDRAESCPACGYGIKLHFEKIRQEEERKIKKEQKKKELQKQEQERKERLQKKLDAIPDPVPPTFSSGMIIYLIVFTLFWAIFILGPHNYNPNKVSAFWGSIIFLDGIPLVIYLINLSKKKEQYEIDKNNVEEYKRRMLEEKTLEEIRKEREDSERMARRIICPNCSSVNIEKITTFDRAVSVGTVGLASNKIGKQYKCKNCKHLW